MRGSRNFCQGVGGGGGGGGVGQTARNQPFFSLQVILQFTEWGPMVLLQRQSRIQRGSNIFLGDPTFSRGGGGGPNANFYWKPYQL